VGSQAKTWLSTLPFFTAGQWYYYGIIRVKGEIMLLKSLDLIAITIALSTSIVVIAMSVRQNMLLQQENMNLRRLLRKEREKNVTRF
jgi:DMSO/TMAO reductase YedYZ heme-binding membrane subunit